MEKYTGVMERIKAIIVDNLVIVGFIFLITNIFSNFENVPNNARIMAFVFVFLLYDPLFTSVFGGTIGHMIIGIRVKREANEKKNILFPLAIIRYVVKVLLGWISLLTVSSNEKNKAIHDYVVGSVTLNTKYLKQKQNEI